MQSSSSSTLHFLETENDNASSSHRFKKSSTKRSTTSSVHKNPKKRNSRSSQDSYTSDDEPKSATKQSKRGKKKDKNIPPSKKSRKGSFTSQRLDKRSNVNGSEFVSGSEDKLRVSKSKTNYSSALNLTPQTGSIEEGEKLFGVLIKPISVHTFMAEHFEQKPIRVQRRFPDYYKDLISTEIIDKMLRENHVEFTKNIDITQYKDGIRETLNPAGRAMPPCNLL